MLKHFKKFGFGIVLAVVPAMLVSAQWTPQVSGLTKRSHDSPVSVSVTQSRDAGLIRASSWQSKAMHSAALQHDGTLTGQVASVDVGNALASNVQGVNVFFVRDGNVVQQAETKSDGSFEISAIAPGSFLTIAFGPNGPIHPCDF